MHYWGLVAFFVTIAQAQTAERVRVDDLGGFFIDKTEVTISQFERFVKDTGLLTQAEREGGGFEFVGGWQRRAGWTWQRPEGKEPSSRELPAVHLNFYEAQKYCNWAKGRLPTAKEWLSAGFTESRPQPPQPWIKGKTYEWTTGNTPNGANTSLPDPWPRAAPAMQTQSGVNGLFNMGGNVWEWSSDAKGDLRRTLGGSWWYPPEQMRADVEAWKSADFYAVYIGFRCVY